MATMVAVWRRKPKALLMCALLGALAWPPNASAGPPEGDATLGSRAAARAVRASQGATPATEPRAFAVRHGSELTAPMTGPRLIGPGPTARVRASTLRDGQHYAFAREIPQTRTYDGFRVEGPHLLIEDVVFEGGIDIFTRRPVVMRGVRVETEVLSHWAVMTRPAAGPFYFLWSETRARGISGAPNDRSQWLARGLSLSGDRATVYRSHITRSADGIQIHGVGSRVIESVVDGLVYWKDDHNDGIQLLGRASDTLIQRCRIENPIPSVSAINSNGQPIRIEGNYLTGGGYTIYGGSRDNGHGSQPARGVVVVDNIFGRDFFPRSGRFGPLAYWEAMQGLGNVWQNNHYADGVPIEAPVTATGKRR